MSIPDVDMPIGFLYETTLMKYAGGKLTKNGMIMTPDEALEHFKDLAIDEGFAVSTIENSAEELLYDLEGCGRTKISTILGGKDERHKRRSSVARGRISTL
jgi:hypothetical protein